MQKKDDELVIRLADFQNQFINNRDLRICVIAGAKGVGKTWTGSNFVFDQIGYAYELGVHEQGLIMLNSTQQVLDVFEQDIRPVLEELRWPYHFNSQRGVLKVFNTTIHMRSSDADAVKRIETIHYQWGWADEVSYYPPSSLEVFTSRIRKGRALIRMTTMPSEPEAFMYSFVENMVEEENKRMGRVAAKFFEVGLRHNPDKEFAERYESFLRSIYSGPKLRCFLFAERVNLHGLSAFAVDPDMKGDMHIDPESEIMLSWDFNNEYRAVSAWQEIGYNEKGYIRVACVKSWKMKEPTVTADAIKMAEMFKKHKAPIILQGDSTGENRTAAVTESMWLSIQKAFDEAGIDYRYHVPRSNPPVKDTIECANWALMNGLVIFDRNERHTYASLTASQTDKYGEIDKSIDYKGDESGPRTHHGDTARYALFHYFQHDYPGGAGDLFAV